MLRLPYRTCTKLSWMEQSSAFRSFSRAANSHALLRLHAGWLPTSTATTIVVRLEDTVVRPHLSQDPGASAHHHRPLDELRRPDEAEGWREVAAPMVSDHDRTQGRVPHATADLDPIHQDRVLEVLHLDREGLPAEVVAAILMRATTGGERVHLELTDLGGARATAATAAIHEVVAEVGIETEEAAGRCKGCMIV